MSDSCAAYLCMCDDNVPMVCFCSMTGTVQDSHRLSVKTWTEEESDRADSTLSRYVCYKYLYIVKSRTPNDIEM